MPWTRFPTEKGMFCAIFKVWENPKPLRDPNQVRTTMRLFLAPDNGELKPNYAQTTGEARWEKFWYAVDRLYQWATRAIVLDKATVDVYIAAFLRCDTRAAVMQHYKDAGLLSPESVHDWVRFRNCRDGDMQLNEDQKDELMKLLLDERRKAVDLFEKMTCVHNICVHLGDAYQFRQFTDLENDMHRKGVEAARAAKTKAEDDAAAAMADLKRADKTPKPPDDGENEAVQGLLALTRGAPGGQAGRLTTSCDCWHIKHLGVDAMADATRGPFCKDMDAKCGPLQDVHVLLDELQQLSVV